MSKTTTPTPTPTYTVAVGSWTYEDGTPAPERTCGHAHKSWQAAERCGDKLYAAKTVRGNWQACATWHGWYVLSSAAREEKAEQVEAERNAWNDAAVRLTTHPY